MNNSLIPVEFAIKLILENVCSLKPEKVKLDKAAGRTLASDVFAPVDLPLFNQSAMDGYAVAFGVDKKFKLVGEIRAGNHFKKTLKSGEAVRIFTGALVPEGADAVIMQEKIKKKDDSITCYEKELILNENIRFRGEQLVKGEIALEKGTVISPAAIGFLASLGITEADVIKRPAVAILVTGDELQKPGSTLKPGMIYESNAIMLKTALEKAGIENINVTTIPDNLNAITNQVSVDFRLFDVIIMSGGISVGAYDFSKKALKSIGVEDIFYKITQKPGKPLFFGKKEDKLVFALPGNPAAALACFYEYVYPALNLLQGKKHPFLPEIQLPLKSDFKKTKKLSFFLKAYARENYVEILDGQGSHMLKSFANANSLVYLPADRNEFLKGEFVEVHLLPF